MSDTRQLDPAAASSAPAAEEWYQLPVEAVLQRLGSSVDGLSPAEGQVRGVAGAERGDFDAVAYVSALASDATVSRTGEVVGDPTEAALVVLAEKLGVSVEETRREYPRLATVPFDSTYKFMATAHTVPLGDSTQVALLVKGGPDVILAHCSAALGVDGKPVPLDEVRERIDAANARLGGSGLRVHHLGGRGAGGGRQGRDRQDLRPGRGTRRLGDLRDPRHRGCADGPGGARTGSVRWDPVHHPRPAARTGRRPP